MINFSLKTLPNGLRVVTAPVSTSDAVTILVLVAVGGRYENKEQSGISHFLEHLFFKGTKKRPSAFEISRELDSLGAEYNAFTSEEYTGFYVKSAASDFLKSLDILADMFLNPIFPEKELEREKGVILEEANMRRDVPQVHVQTMSTGQMFGDTPLGRDLVGTPEAIKAISRQDILSYRKGGYSPESTIVVVCGNPKNHLWLERIERFFAHLEKSPSADFSPYHANMVKDKVVQQVRKVDQTHFVFSTLTFSKTDPRRWALSLLTTILGGGMSSRLFSEIREKRGWAYYVRADLGAFRDIGYLDFSAGVSSDKLQDSVKLILEEIEDIKSNGPKEEELKRAEANLKGHLALSLEDSFEIADFLADSILYENRVRQSEEIIKNVDLVGPEDIKLVSRDIFSSDKIGLSIIGPKDYKKEVSRLI